MQPPSTDATPEPLPSAATAASTAAEGHPQTASTDVTGVWMERAPAMAAVAAVSGLFASVLLRVLLPMRAVGGSGALWGIIAHLGAFAANLSMLGSLVALGIGLWPWLRNDSELSTRRRLLLLAFVGMLAPVLLRATFFPREAMSGALASLGAATATTLAILVIAGALRQSRPSVVLLAISLLAVTATFCSLAGLTLQTLALVAPFSTVHRVGPALTWLGEISYLGVMLCAVGLLPRPPFGLWGGLALAAGGATTVTVALAFRAATTALHREFAIGLYYAQHVTLWLESAMWIYGIVLALGIGASTIASLDRAPQIRQLGIAVLAWIAAGYAPRAPWRFALLTLAACLIARALAASAGQVRKPHDGAAD